MTCIDVSSSVGLSWLLVDQVTLDSDGLTRYGRGADLRWLPAVADHSTLPGLDVRMSR